MERPFIYCIFWTGKSIRLVDTVCVLHRKYLHRLVPRCHQYLYIWSNMINHDIWLHCKYSHSTVNLLQSELQSDKCPFLMREWPFSTGKGIGKTGLNRGTPMFSLSLTTKYRLLFICKHSEFGHIWRGNYFYIHKKSVIYFAVTRVCVNFFSESLTQFSWFPPFPVLSATP